MSDNVHFNGHVLETHRPVCIHCGVTYDCLLLRSWPNIGEGRRILPVCAGQKTIETERHNLNDLPLPVHHQGFYFPGINQDEQARLDEICEKLSIPSQIFRGSGVPHPPSAQDRLAEKAMQIFQACRQVKEVVEKVTIGQETDQRYYEYEDKDGNKVIFTSTLEEAEAAEAIDAAMTDAIRQCAITRIYGTTDQRKAANATMQEWYKWWINELRITNTNEPQPIIINTKPTGE